MKKMMMILVVIIMLAGTTVETGTKYIADKYEKTWTVTEINSYSSGKCIDVLTYGWNGCVKDKYDDMELIKVWQYDKETGELLWYTDAVDREGYIDYIRPFEM